MPARYLIRIDDVCPTMNWERFSELRMLLEQYQIRPIIGIIPDNQDPQLKQYSANSNFWTEMRTLAHQNWIIAQHGYQHIYETRDSGLLKINEKSEFAGLSYDQQKYKIALGKKILEERLEQSVTWWMAPAHSFDETTCHILKELDFHFITDGIALSPFEKFGLTWVPQQLWRPRKKFFGIWTICIHLDTIDQKSLGILERFIGENQTSFLNPQEFSLSDSINCTIANTLYSLWWRIQFLIYKIFFK